MQITRKSHRFNQYLKSLYGVEAIFAGCEEVVTGYRQEKVSEDSDELVNVEVKGLGAALYSFDWPDDWGAPPSEQDLDNWEAPKDVEVVVVPLAERAKLYKAKVDDAWLRLYAVAALIDDVNKSAAFLSQPDALSYALSGGSDKAKESLLKLAEKYDVKDVEQALG